jgi:hypothetical protein
MALRLIQFLAIILTALALVPSGAHIAALPNKMAMARQPTSSPSRSMLDGLSSALSFSALWRRIWRTRSSQLVLVA